MNNFYWLIINFSIGAVWVLILTFTGKGPIGWLDKFADNFTIGGIGDCPCDSGSFINNITIRKFLYFLFGLHILCFMGIAILAFTFVEICLYALFIFIMFVKLIIKTIKVIKKSLAILSKKLS
ncbi:MAG: hypothetical protein PF549_04510 [Patescibacteria group bacterium]|jgi:hypothetical protein|nr:hypothetical protein [Patescibacteria group bacterium]